jgi:hypothetical protein
MAHRWFVLFEAHTAAHDFPYLWSDFLLLRDNGECEMDHRKYPHSAHTEIRYKGSYVETEDKVEITCAGGVRIRLDLGPKETGQFYESRYRNWHYRERCEVLLTMPDGRVRSMIMFSQRVCSSS